MKESPNEEDKGTLQENSNEDKGNGKNFLKNFLKEKEPKTSEFIVAIVVNLIFLYIVNNLLSWNLSFIASSFQDVLWIFNISISATIIGNIIFLIYHPAWFRSIIRIILNILGFLVVYYLYIVFPFVFSNYLVTFSVKFALIVAMVVIVIATIVEMVKLILRIIKSS
ncbi:hypothetical protein [uncultured Methanobacterium sp.]|uniref:hypothetical protein n=1 Tax=uncultured Methanobacterium sp. TaxID=176306 RepID=UPI002AA8C840|nr:hypothetical protein [uncultured Methanobacterium sp.]